MMKIILIQQEEIKYLKDKNLNLLKKIEKISSTQKIIPHESKKKEFHSYFEDLPNFNKNDLFNIANKEDISDDIIESISNIKPQEEKITINHKQKNGNLKAEFNDFNLNIQNYKEISKFLKEKEKIFELNNLHVIEVKGNIDIKQNKNLNDFKLSCDSEFEGFI